MYILTMFRDFNDSYFGDYEEILEAHEKAEELLKEDHRYTGYEIKKFKE